MRGFFYCKRLRNNQEKPNFEGRLKKRDGTALEVRLDSVFINDAESQADPYRIAVSDISDLKRAEAEKTSMETTLRQTQKMQAIGTLAGGIAHEFNNILNVIIGCTEVAMETVPEEERAGKMLEVCQIILNLCANGISAMKNKGTLTIGLEKKELHTAISMYPLAATPGPYAVLSVADTGYGMDKDTIERIFDPFFTTKEVGEGTGLGLALVYTIMQRNGGAIEVKSEQGNGTVFTLYFPISIVEELKPEPRRDFSIVKGNERILLVDDDEMVATRVSDTL